MNIMVIFSIHRLEETMNFTAFTEDILQNRWNVFGAEVYVDGRLAHAFGDTTENRHPIYSATKTVTSIALGMAMDDGKLDIAQPLLHYLPGDVVGRMTQEQREMYRHITLRRLMCMSVAGYPFRARGDSWLIDSLSYPLPQPESPSFDYSNISAYLAGVAAACALNENLYAFLCRRLFEPLGIRRPPATFCPDGYFYGASGMELTVNELSKIGLLLYNGGVFDGQRLLSADYVRQATSVQQMNREGGYGYFLWKYRDGFSINGKWKQKCYILPKEGLMVTYLSHIEDPGPELKQSMEKHILGIQE